MSYPVLDDWFSVAIRRNRKSFIFATVMLIVVVATIFLVVLFFKPSATASLLLLTVFGIPFMICQYLLTAQRLRDLNLTGWLYLLWIPFNMIDNYLNGAASLTFWIILCAVPGTHGSNRYGGDPLLVSD